MTDQTDVPVLKVHLNNLLSQQGLSTSSDTPIAYLFVRLTVDTHANPPVYVDVTPYQLGEGVTIAKVHILGAEFNLDDSGTRQYLHDFLRERGIAITGKAHASAAAMNRAADDLLSITHQVED